jgi:RHS repeat-associated protein
VLSLHVETDKHYNYFRDYEPSLGRYLESDPIGLRGGINSYGYVYGQPLAYIDPTGESVGAAIALIGIPLAGYLLWDKFDQIQKCVRTCEYECSFIKACEDPERTSQYEDNKPRCINSCKPKCTFGFGGPKKGPTGPQAPKNTPDYFPSDPLPPYTWSR